MSDNLNENRSISADEASRRAERINAIKKSVRGAAGAVILEERPAEATEPDVKDAPAADTWESDLAERIGRHSGSSSPKKALTLEEILAEIDQSANKPNEADVPEKTAASVIAPVPEEEASSELFPDAEAAEEVQMAADESVSETDNRNDADAAEIPEKRTAPIRRLAPVAAVKKENPSAEEANEASVTAEEVTAENSDAPKKKKKKKKKKTLKESLLGLLPQKGDSILERIRKLVFLGAVLVIIVCGYMIGDYYIDLWRSSRENDKYMNNYWDYDDTPSTKPSEPKDDEAVDNRKVYTLLEGAEYFLDINKDVVGVIRIPDTPVNNPVMQSDDNDKYLDRKMNGRESRAGELFLDYRNSFDRVDSEGHLAEPNSDNLIIYGHNMKDEQMFGCLKSYERDGSFYGKHPVIELNSNYERYTYKIFSVFLLDAEDESSTEYDCWNYINFSSEEEFYEFVNEAKRRTIRLNDVDVKYGDKLLTLSTCNTLLGDRGRLIVMGRLVREGEDPMEGTQNNSANPNIKWPTLYYTYRPSAKKYDPDAEFVPFGETQAQETTSGE